MKKNKNSLKNGRNYGIIQKNQLSTVRPRSLVQFIYRVCGQAFIKSEKILQILYMDDKGGHT